MMLYVDVCPPGGSFRGQMKASMLPAPICAIAEA
jgi:hypothetical protein